jgi:hypothetical protein
MTRTVASRCADAAGCRLLAWRGWSRSFPRRLRVPAAAAAPGLPRNGPGEIVIRQAAISCERSSRRRRPPKARSALASSQQSLSIVSGSASCWARYSSTSSFSVSVLPTPFSRRRCSSARSSASAASRSEEKPPRCRRLEAGPSVRYRYAHTARVDRALLELEDLTLLHRRSLPSHVERCDRLRCQRFGRDASTRGNAARATCRVASTPRQLMPRALPA